MNSSPESLVSHLGLDPAVASAFYGRFTQLQPHQYAAAEILLSGQNLVLCAGTGTGKSEAVLAPLISRFRRQAAQTQAVTWLYLAPTRALLNDMALRLRLQTQELGLQIGLRHGDQNDLAGSQRPQFLLTTPESLEVMLLHGSTRLRQLQAVILDEAHSFFYSQRGLQLGILLQRLGQSLSGPLQWAALSATLAEPLALRDFLFGPQTPAQVLQLPATRKIDAQIRCVADPEALIQLMRRLLLNAPAKLLCFCLSRTRCESLASWLNTDPTLRPLVMTHYATLAAPVRQAVEARFASQRSAICLATSTLELGIDIGDVDAVVLWEPPAQLESFLQQLGRGNRRQPKQNLIALVSAPPATGLVQALGFAAWLALAEQPDALRFTGGELYGAALQQLLAMLAAMPDQFVPLNALMAPLAPWPWLNPEVVTTLLEQLVGSGHLQRHPWKPRYGAAAGLWELVEQQQIYGNFPAESGVVALWHGSKCLGTVPEINSKHLGRGEIVRFQGRCWAIASADAEGLHLEPLPALGAAADFIYPRREAPADPLQAEAIRRLIWGEWPLPEGLHAPLQAQLQAWLTRFRQLCPAGSLPYSRQTDEATGLERWSYLTCAGALLNALLADWSGLHCWQHDALSVTLSGPVDWASLPAPETWPQPEHLLAYWPERTRYQHLLPLDLQAAECASFWRQHPLTAPIQQRLRQAEAVEVPVALLQSLDPRL